MIKALLFDWGGVMSDGGRGGELAERLSRNLGISFGDADKLIESVWIDFTSGTLSEDNLWRKIEQQLGQPVPSEKRNIWNTWDHTGVVDQMKRLVEQLRADGYAVGLVSNVIPPTANEIRTHGGYDLFDFTILSFEVGASKPEPDIYKIAMDRLNGVLPSEVVFIDDQQRCTDAAEQMGMQAILAKNPAQVITDIQKLLKV